MTNDPTPLNSPTVASAITLTKHHGLGNDFLVALEPGAPIGPAEAVAWCHRRTGIGADGLMVAHPVSGDSGADGDTHWRMALFNADGSRAEISGNGIRCLGQAIARRLKLDPSETHELTIDTDAGIRVLSIRPTVEGSSAAVEPDEIQVRVGMGLAVDGPGPSDAWVSVGVEVIEQVGVDIGNPHLVAFVSSVDGFDMAVVGPAVEAGYPDGCNVHLVEVVDRSTIRLEVWERGAGVTQACGSGACAAGWAANRLGLVDDVLTVRMPGGEAEVDLTDAAQVHLIGPATYVAEVIVRD